jgi:hypothetical protein
VADAQKRVPPVYDWVAGVVILLPLVLLAQLWSSLPVFSDSWYHLGVVRAFAERGVTLHDWWQFAPFGRPHLYSPLFHLVNLALLRSTSLNLLDLTRLYAVVTFPVLLAAGWWAARLWFGPRVALLTVLLLALNIGLLIPCSLIMMPGTSAVALWPFVLILVQRQRGVWAGLLLAVIGYLHFGMAGLAAGSLLLLAMFDRQCRRPTLVAVVIGVVLFSPWLAHLVRHREFLQASMGRFPVFLPVFTLLGAALGVVAFCRHREKEPVAIAAMILASGVLLLTAQDRFWTYSGFTFALLGGYGIDRCLGRYVHAALVLLLVSAVSVTPFLRPVRHRFALPVPVQTTPGVLGTPLLTLAWWQQPDVAAQIPSGMTPDLMNLAVWVHGHVPKDEVLLTTDPLLGGSLFVLTGRRTTAGLWGEVMTEQLRKQVAEYYRTAPGYVILTTLAPEPVAAFGRYTVLRRP